MENSKNSNSQRRKLGFTEFELAAQQWRLQQKSIIPADENLKESKKSSKDKQEPFDNRRSRSRSRSRHKKRRRDRSGSHGRKDSREKRKKKKDKSSSRSPPRNRDLNSHRYLGGSALSTELKRSGRESPTYSPYRGNTAPASNDDEIKNELRRIEMRRRRMSRSRSRTPDKVFSCRRSISRSRSSSESSYRNINSSWGHDKFSKVSPR